MDKLTKLRSEIDGLRLRSANAGSDSLENHMNEARALLRDAFQTELEEEARQLFRELRDRRDNYASLTPKTGTNRTYRRGEITKRIQRERLRLHSSSTLSDMELAVEELYGVLCELAPPKDDQGDASEKIAGLESNGTDTEWQFRQQLLRSDVLETLETAAAKSPQLRRKVIELLGMPDMLEASDIADLFERLAKTDRLDVTDAPSSQESGNGTTPVARPTPPPPITSSPPTATPPPPRATPRQVPPDATIAQRLTDGNRLFYAGDYYEAIDIYTEILRLDPENEEAQARLTQIETNIKRGIVPDRQVPFEARAAFGRAQSLERAGRYEEAKTAYETALLAARKAGPLLENWHPAVEALTRVETSVIAQEARNEADDLLRNDQWREAMGKYEAVLRLLPEDSYAKERVAALRTLIQQLEAARIFLDKQVGDPTGASQAIINLIHTIQNVRPQLGISPRLAELENTIEIKTQLMIERMDKRSRQLGAQANEAHQIAERHRMLSEAILLITQIHELRPEDDGIFERLQTAKAMLSRLEEAEQRLDEARRLLDNPNETRFYRIRDLLQETSAYQQLPVYRQLLNDLQRRYLSKAEDAIKARDFSTAEQFLGSASDPIFKKLKRAEIRRLKQNLADTRQRHIIGQVIGLVGSGIIIVMMLVVVARFAYPAWFAAAAPTPTQIPPTATSTPRPTATTRPTKMPTATLVPTNTAVPTLAASITPAYGPTEVPTDAPLYGAVNTDTAARLEADEFSPWAFTLQAADPVQVLAEIRDDDGDLWYKVRYIRGDSTLIGWVQAYNINVQPSGSP